MAETIEVKQYGATTGIGEIRKYYPGFVGGKKVAKKATNKKIKFLAIQTNILSDLSNFIEELKEIRNRLTVRST